jgi:hypothetical protein
MDKMERMVRMENRVRKEIQAPKVFREIPGPKGQQARMGLMAHQAQELLGLSLLEGPPLVQV